MAAVKPMELVFEIGRDGGVQMEVMNGDGKHCVEVSKAFQDALGETISDQIKPEFFEGVKEAKKKVETKAK